MEVAERQLIIISVGKFDYINYSKIKYIVKLRIL